MFEAILGAALAYYVYKNLMSSPSAPSAARSRNVRPQVAYATHASLNRKPNHPTSIVQSRQDLGRLGTPRVDSVDRYTGQILISHHKNPNLTDFYKV